MGDGPSESWTGKGARRGRLCIKTCPFCEEGPKEGGWVLNKRVKDDEHSRRMREWDRRIKAIFGTEGL